MAGVRDKDLITQRGFPAGVDNVSPDQALPRDDNGSPLAARALVNLDLVDGKPRTRPGRTRLAEGDWHSPGKLKGRAMVAVKDGDLVQFDRDGNVVKTLRAGVGPAPVSYAEVAGDLWWSNSTLIRRLRRADLADLPIGPVALGAPNAEPYPTGGMAPGEYVVAATWLDDEGRESGAWGAIEVQVAAGQGIRVFDIPPCEGAAVCRLYVSPPNGSELYAAKEVAAGTTNTLLTAANVREAGRALETLWHQPFPACTDLQTFNARLFGVQGKNQLVWSPAMRPALHHGDDYLREGMELTLFRPLENAGIWLANHKATYWIEGIEPKRGWKRVIKFDAAAVRGVSVVVPGNIVGLETTAPCAVWVSADGVFCAGLPDGTLVRLTDRRLVMPAGESGTMFLREHDGLRQLVASYQVRQGNAGLAFTEKVTATVTRHGG